MKRSNYQCFYLREFLNENLHKAMLDLENQCAYKGLLISEDGQVTEDHHDLVIKNRYKNNSLLKQNLPESLVQVVELCEQELIKNGLKNPVVYNLKSLINPLPPPGIEAHGWHKDFNLITHIDDPLKLWFTMLSLSGNECDSTIMVSPTPEGPGLWNIGYNLTLESNLLVGHNMNLGHHFKAGNKNDLSLLYIRWYDAG